MTNRLWPTMIFVAFCTAPLTASAVTRAQADGPCVDFRSPSYRPPLARGFVFDGHRFEPGFGVLAEEEARLKRVGEMAGHPLLTDPKVPRAEVAVLYVPVKAGCLQEYVRRVRVAVPATPAAPPPLPDGPAVCVLAEGELRWVPVQIDSATGDTMVAGRPFRDAYPATSPAYVENAYWYRSNRPLPLTGLYRVKYGLPRRMDPAELVRVGSFHGTPLFAERGWPNMEVIYAPVRPGCEFQPYQNDL